jgi:hypothetical protein
LTLTKSSPAAPFKVLLALTLFVLLVHVALLTSAPLSLSLSPPQPAKVFITRAVLAPPLPITLDKPPSPAKKPAPKSKPVAPLRSAPVVEPTPVALERPLSPAAQELVEPVPAKVDEGGLTTPSEQANEPASAQRPPRELAVKISAIQLPGSVRVTYKVEANKFPYSASGELLWQQDGTHYNARLALSSFGQTRVQTSRGLITEEGLAPTRFSDKYRSEVAAHFNREQGKVTFSANTPDVPLLSGAQDRLSVLIQLATLIAGDPPHFQNATTLTLQVIGARDGDTWLFTVGEEETLALPGGSQRALKLVRNPRQEFDQKVELWLGTNLNYLPVRIKITEPNGDFLDQKWQSLENATEPLPL